MNNVIVDVSQMSKIQLHAFFKGKVNSELLMTLSQVVPRTQARRLLHC